MQEARNLTQAERCSLFLVENDELVAKVFDGHVLDVSKQWLKMLLLLDDLSSCCLKTKLL